MAALRDFMDFPSDHNVRCSAAVSGSRKSVSVHAQGFERGNKGPDAARLARDHVIRPSDLASTAELLPAWDIEANGHKVPMQQVSLEVQPDAVELAIQTDCTDSVMLARIVTRGTVHPRHILLAVESCVSHGLIVAITDALDPRMYSHPDLSEAWDVAVCRGDDEEVRTLRKIMP